MLVSKTAPSAFQDNLAAVVPGHVRNDLARLRFLHDRPFRHLQHDVIRICAMASPLAAGKAVLCGKFPSVAVVLQGI